MISILSAVVALFLAQPAHPLDYYAYAQQWPNGACMNPAKKCNAQLPTTFTIHGLWPSNIVKPHPDSCAKSFNSSLINSLVPQLSNVWPNIEKGNTNVRFWGYEWNKHGSCSPFSQYNYFNHAISLYNQNNLMSMLAAQNILPNGTSHPPQDFINAIQLDVHVQPLLVCVNRNYLAEIHLCFDAAASIHINCPRPSSPTCSNSVIF
ncbi:unnamed protein product [Lathyrus sativus]|nr:unnamed protein product [Lathyrus sativus]CAK8055326.1 unnamed protein product [Lathyrus sativus]CAK8055328.1 unnamed protein product [Lathyrus sativus]CAK8055329.1 unnamed protein product [Lathyrus sativus]